MENATYKVIKNALTKEYVELVLNTIRENNLVEAHPFLKFEGIKIDYKLIDPEGKIQDILLNAENYFRENYLTPGRELVLSRSYGTIMHQGAQLEPHKDLYNSGREHDFSYGDALVCNVYLSDCDGGELGFPELNTELKINAGDVVLFPGYLLTHSVNPVNSGTRITILNHFSLLSEEDTKNIDSIAEKLKK
jgi:predicted 2-oxoglutarate/Fe(II)-dependent dioxygenase YbiX